MPFQRGKWENLLPFPQLVEEGFSVAAEDQVRWNILRLSLDSWKQKRCETQGYLDEEVKPPPSLGQLWSAWRWVQRWNLPWQWCWWGTCFGPNGKQEVSLEEINSLGLPLPFFLGFVSLELHVQKGQEWCGWNISVSVLGWSVEYQEVYEFLMICKHSYFLKRWTLLDVFKRSRFPFLHQSLSWNYC